ncbi:MAG: cbb3-type cytochrome c oxidase subunit 3 [Piscinibacter sp.]|nr:cbb3-type cytochrome c oxidase subunit 3 [Piscinibacter sp.]
MDINDLRSIVTVVSLLTFLGIVAWAWSRGNRASFEEAARLPFADEAADVPVGEPGRTRQGEQQ